MTTPQLAEYAAVEILASIVAIFVLFLVIAACEMTYAHGRKFFVRWFQIMARWLDKPEPTPPAPPKE